MRRVITEVCTDNINSALAADRAGANRIELCQALSEGGLTPSPALIRYCCENLKLGVMVLIRPRGGDFLYNEVEFDLIKRDVLYCKESGAGGVVVGFLDKDGNVDKQKLKEIVDLAGGMEVVFHRAFDRCSEWRVALEDIIESGCCRILTSGLHDTAYEGRFLLKEIIESAGDRIAILVGSGVVPGNINDIYNVTGFREVHFSAKHEAVSGMRYIRETIKPIRGQIESSDKEIAQIMDICATL
jgi:copper homeostasis protein